MIRSIAAPTGARKGTWAWRVEVDGHTVRQGIEPGEHAAKAAAERECNIIRVKAESAREAPASYEGSYIMKGTAVKGLQPGKAYTMALDHMTAWHNIFTPDTGPERHSINLRVSWKGDLGWQMDFVPVYTNDEGAVEFGPNSALSRLLTAATGLTHDQLQESDFELKLGQTRSKKGKGTVFGDSTYEEPITDEETGEVQPGWYLLPTNEEAREAKSTGDKFDPVPCDIEVNGFSILHATAVVTLKEGKNGYNSVKSYAPDPNAADLPF